MISTGDKGRPATSVDVARLAGVSRATVSHVLNGNGDRFLESTRERVLAAARELSYQPSLAGRSLASGRSDTIVVLLPNTTFGSNLQDAVDAVVRETTTIGGNVVVRFAGTDPNLTVAAVSALRPLAVVDFGVLTVADRESIGKFGTIVVPELRTDPSTIPDGGLAEIQAQALLGRGPRQLWFAAISDERLDPYGPGRLLALQQFCERNALPAPHRVTVPFDVAGAVGALSEVLADGLPAGVACYNDDVALALLAAARELGVAVPDDLSVVGVDHTRPGQLWSPRLTTVDTDLRALVNGLSIELRAHLEGRVVPSQADARHFTLVPGETH